MFKSTAWLRKISMPFLSTLNNLPLRCLHYFSKTAFESFEILHTKHANFKGTDHDFCWSGKPVYYFSEASKYAYISKQITKSP